MTAFSVNVLPDPVVFRFAPIRAVWMFPSAFEYRTDGPVGGGVTLLWFEMLTVVANSAMAVAITITTSFFFIAFILLPFHSDLQLALLGDIRRPSAEISKTSLL